MKKTMMILALLGTLGDEDFFVTANYSLVNALRPEYCGDIPNNGIHLTQAGAIRWVEYLLNHTVDFEEG